MGFLKAKLPGGFKEHKGNILKKKKRKRAKALSQEISSGGSGWGGARGEY